MTFEEARADLMLAQADISYRPKDDSIDMAIKALENQKSIIEELEDLFEKMRRRNNQKGHDDYWYFSNGINLVILDKRICELKGIEWKPYIERKIEAELKGENNK